MLFLISALGCTIQEEELPVPGPSVTREEAIAVAKQTFGIIKVNQVEIRHLEPEEWAQVPEEAKQFTPVYFVIQGQRENGAELTVKVY